MGQAAADDFMPKDETTMEPSEFNGNVGGPTDRPTELRKKTALAVYLRECPNGSVTKKVTV